MFKSLVGSDWKSKRKKGNNQLMNRIVIINHSYFEDDHVDCDIEDSCDEDDYENMKLQKMVEEV